MVNEAIARRETTTVRRVAESIWPVVLAAGSGRRLASVTGGAPKQFWRPDGDRHTLLEETLTRVSTLGSKAQISVIVDQGHEPYVRAVNPAWQDVRWVYQPRDCGTAAGVLLALTPVLDLAPDQMVLLTPSDHGVLDALMFRQSTLDAAEAVVEGIADVVLFGMTPATMSADYGWIIPGALCAGSGREIRRVIGFREKPSQGDVPHLLALRALWSTMVIVTRAATLRRLYEMHLPQVATLFADYLALPAGSRAGFLSAAYRTLQPSDFSRDVLAHARGLAVHVWPASIGWADLGTPDRLREWMDRAGQRGKHHAA
jgi:mannose-1-phosphate guanylyltransferase